MLTALLVAVSFTGCSVDNDPFITASEDDFPRILNTDIEETEGGAPSKLPNIYRNENFVFEVIVTPAEYTTVTWFIDGEEVFQGKKIDMPVLAGDHDVKIVATTTRGLSTYRNCTLKVLPLDGDPVLAKGEKNLWCQAGTVKTINGSNLQGITEVYINGVKCDGLRGSDDGSSLTFTVPGLEDGKYQMTVVKDGVKYGMGKVTVDAEAFPESTAERVLWEGEFAVTWGTPFSELQGQAKQWFADGTWKEGTTIRVYVSGNGQGAVTTAWWNNPFTGLDGEANRGDIMISGDQVLEYTFTDVSGPKLTTEDGMLIVGDGYTITKVTMMVSEVVLWEGEFAVTWGTPFNALQESSKALFADGTLAEGKTLLVTCSGNGGQAALTSAWWNNIMTGLDGEANRGDVPVNGNVVLEFVLTDVSGPKVQAEDGMLIVGDGYTITKVAVK